MCILAVTSASPVGPVLAGINTFMLSKGVGDPSRMQNQLETFGCDHLMLYQLKITNTFLYLLPSLKVSIYLGSASYKL